MNDKVNDLYDKFIREFLRIKSSRDNVSKYNLETNILTLHRYANKQPYIFTILYEGQEGGFEAYCILENERRNKEYENFCRTNGGRLMQDFGILSGTPTKDALISNVEINDEEDILSKFFLSVDKELYDIYKDMLAKNNILRVTDNETETLFDKKSGETYILCGKEPTVKTMIRIAREMGQVYRYHTKKELITTYEYDMYLRSEMTGFALELLFVKYLIENDLYSDVATEYLKAYNNEIIRDSQMMIDNKLFVNNKKVNGLGNMTELLGKIVSHNFVNSNMTFKDFTDYVHTTKTARILNDINIIELSDNITKSFCLKR